MTGIPVYIFPEMFKFDSDFDINKIRFSDTPYLGKNDSMLIDMYVSGQGTLNAARVIGQAIIIQLPKYKLHCKLNDKLDDKLILELSDMQFNEYFIQPLEEYICKIIHKKSEKWFNGKKFTMNKITGSLVSPFKKIENGKCLLNLSITKNTTFFDRYKNKISTINFDENTELITLIKLANVFFIKNKFSYNLILEQAKVFIEEKLIGYSIIERSFEIETEIESEIEHSNFE